MDTRVVIAEGDAFVRGRIVGAACAEDIRAILTSQDFMNILDRSGNLRDWLPRARKALPLIEEHAPVSLGEMQGLAEGAGLDFEDILLLTCSYDKSFQFMSELAEARQVKGKSDTAGCTSFAALTPNGLICAENNDDRPWDWDNANHDVVLHLIDSDGLEVLNYTHPGILATFGMNSAGLVLMWMYIDNGDRADGLPTYAMVRETLSKRTLAEAVDYLRSVPRCMPNAFLLARDGEGICSVEAAPSGFGASWSETYFTHANVIYEPELYCRDDRGRRLKPPLRQRDCRMARLVGDTYPHITVDDAKRFVSDSEDLDHEKGINNEWTLANLVFHPTAGELHIAIGMGLERHFETVSFRNARRS